MRSSPPFSRNKASLQEGKNFVILGQCVKTWQRRVLYFKSIRVRQTAIKDAHAKTFQWIFESSLDSSQPRSTFLDWLKRGKDIYWVSGKAGSGKSTLVKYLCDHKHTRGALETCASEEKLVMASYFFWISGTMMQKSQEGLLQSLLYQILQQCPHLIPTICPSRWNKPAMLLERDSWTRQELLQAFNVLSEEGNLSTKFCLFIDGLDEYDGEHTDIIRILQNFANSSSIKLCISSRPWNPFIEAFGRKVDQKMLLQDFTKADIKLYVKSQLQEDRRFLELMKSDSRYHLLIKDIIDKAQGMFLWVYLVVRSLLRGLTDDNDIVTLQLRVKKLPADLETFFKQIFDTVEDVYLEQTAQIFQIAVYALSPPPILAYAFLKKEAGDPNYFVLSFRQHRAHGYSSQFSLRENAKIY